jgi:hypothetical protein
MRLAGSASSREQKGGDGAKAPFRSLVRCHGVHATVERETDGLFAEIIDVTDREIDRDRPLVLRPVEGRLAVQRERGGILPCVGEERLEEHLVDLGPVVAASRIGEGPDLIGEDAVGPALLLLQDHGGRARARLGLYTIAA